VTAGMNVNVWDVNEHIQELVRSGATVDPARLRDADVALDGLVGG
jgi:3-phenylpropionate/trans-cinnamate dioxygenase ferredoxin reductase component